MCQERPDGFPPRRRRYFNPSITWRSSCAMRERSCTAAEDWAMPSVVSPTIRLISSMDRLISSDVELCSSAAVAMEATTEELAAARSTISFSAAPEELERPVAS